METEEETGPVSEHEEKTAHGVHAVPVSERIMSVDVLRGFDMFWLVGGAGFALALTRLIGGRVAEFGAWQLEHAEWVGFRFYDLIFPLFVFVVGMSVVFSLGTLLEREGRLAAYRRILRRVVLMLLLGVFYYGGMRNEWSDIRWLGVLQRLALCYGISGLLYCHLRTRGLVIVFALLMIGYWIWLAFIPVPGQSAVSWTYDVHWPAYIDEHFLPGRRYFDNKWDPEGILSTLPAVCTALLGVFAAQLLTARELPAQKKVWLFILGGIAMVAAGELWGLHFPVIKKIWTSSYVLVAGGFSMMLVGIFYQIVDVWKIRWWTAPFVWIGANSLTIYLLRNILDLNELADRFVGGSVAAACSEDVAYFLRMTVSLALSLIIVRFLYKRKIFLRV